jgi:hypothetical protein
VADLRIAAMVAPYFSGLLYRQSDFGHPAGAVGDMIVSGFRCFGLYPKSGLWHGSRQLRVRAAAVIRVVASIGTD